MLIVINYTFEKINLSLCISEDAYIVGKRPKKIKHFIGIIDSFKIISFEIFSPIKNPRNNC